MPPLEVELLATDAASDTALGRAARQPTAVLRGGELQCSQEFQVFVGEPALYGIGDG
jgi:hypothetical protein